MRYQPAHAAKSGSVPFMLRGPKSVRTVLSAAVAGAIAFAPAVLISAPAQAAISGFKFVDTTVIADEGDQLVFEVTRDLSDSAINTGTDVDWSIAGGTSLGDATADEDYTDDSGTLHFPADTTPDADGKYGGDTLTITVDSIQDTTDEPTEAFTVNLESGGSTDSAEGRITDDDNAPGYTLIVSDPMPAEDLAGGKVTVTAELDEVSGKDVSIPVTVAAGTAKSGQDYTFTPGSITIPRGTNTSSKLYVNITDDDLYEASEQDLTVNGGASTTVTGTESAKVTIVDDEEAPQITIAGTTIDEGGSLVFDVTSTGASERPMTAAWTTADGPGADEPDSTDGTAKAGTDYTAATGTVTFAAATTNTPADASTKQKITVKTVSDTIAEATEDMHVTLSNPTIGVLGDDKEATGSITDTDPNPTATLSPTAAITEGNSGRTAKTYTVKLNKESGQVVKVDYDVAGSGLNAADNVSDIFDTSGTLTFQPGETSKSFTVDIVGDTTDEPDETFDIDLDSSTADVTGNGTSGTVTVTIKDDDATPTYTVAPIVMNEGDTGSVAVFPIKLSNPSYQESTFTIGSITGSATDDIAGAPGEFDYIAPTGTVTIPAGQTTGYLYFLVNGDEVFEPNETVTVPLTASGNIDGDDSDASLTITNDDDMPSFEVTSVTGNEGDTVDVMGVVTGVAQDDTFFNINFAGASVKGSTAASADDFTNPGTKAVKIDGGTLSGTPKLIASLKLTDDATPEGPETILASGNAVNGTVVNGVVTIAASDGGAPAPAPTLMSSSTYRLGVGSLRLSGKVAAGATVKLWGTPIGADADKPWQDLGTTTANSQGEYSFFPRFTTTGWWFRTAVGDQQSNAIKVYLKQDPDFYVRSSATGTATLSVFGDPRVGGLSVRLLRANSDGTWSTVGTGRLNSEGKYVRVLTGLKSGKSYLYKATVYGDGDVGMLTNTSKSARVTIR
ncbi:Calx-beta domain-containing protein [Actinoplanes sp. NPDC049681]|uniref:Calx-beta domain-containing protein n=1 Tax=Actinoplanes sp. NPDC049681 TaxID=3363905 RepID=UPI00379B8923